MNDGIALYSAEHPKKPWWRRIFARRDVRKESLETIEITLDAQLTEIGKPKVLKILCLEVQVLHWTPFIHVGSYW